MTQITLHGEFTMVDALEAMFGPDWRTLPDDTPSVIPNCRTTLRDLLDVSLIQSPAWAAPHGIIVFHCEEYRDAVAFKLAQETPSLQIMVAA